MNKEPVKDWKRVRLGEYVISVKGKKPKRISPVKTKECSMPYVNIKAFEKKVIDEYTDGIGCALCDEGDFLMVWDGSRSGYVGKAIKGAIGSTLVKLNFPNINNNYAYYFLQSKFIEINTKAKGVGIPHVDPNILWNYELFIPPPKTQLFIVSKIEELFSKLDKGIETLLTAQQQLKTYRQSVLKWAFEGRLTNTNIKEGELPNGWKWKKLGELMESVRNGYSKKPGEIGSFKILRISSVRSNKVSIDEFRLLENEISLENALCENDLLFTRYNGSIDFVGVCGRVPKLKEKIFYPDKLIRCRPKIKEWFHSAYIDYAANSRLARQFVLSKIKTTAGQTGISGSDIKEIPIPLPPLEEQFKIVLALESRLSVADKMEENITQSLQQAEALRQSILKKAFEGKL